MASARSPTSNLLIMSWILLTNDDGIDSPALVPFAKALSKLAETRVVVPDQERSWISKAITRFQHVTHEVVERGGIEMHTVSGFPADAVQIGSSALFDTSPALVVSGINLGFNHGAGFALGSGTVGAAFEGWAAGIPSIAVSTQGGPSWQEWQTYSQTEDATPMWERVAAVAADIVDSVRSSDIFAHADIVSVNLPADATFETARKVSPLARVRYGPLFNASGDGFDHSFRGDLVELGEMEGTDIAVTSAGQISIAPLRAPASPTLPEDLVRALEAVN